jgi:glycosyltransferase involved in cell wall biosynthesis
MTKISICTPVYTMKDQLGEKFLVEFFSSLMAQTFKDFEVVISDQSEGDNMKMICDTFSHVLNIKYVKNLVTARNAAANVNYAIKHATGEIVKLLYMDDFFVDVDALGKIAYAFDNNVGSWLIAGFVCCDQEKTNFYNARQPSYNNKYVNGDNTTGNPSNYSVRRDCALEMDENLLWIVDGEYFYRSYYHYGDPIMIKDVLVCFRDHGDSAFKRPDLRDLDAKERQYCVEKFSRPVELKLV